MIATRMPQHRSLVTSVGTGGKSGYSETRYRLEGHGEIESELAPIALAHLLDVDEVLVPCTTASLEAYDHREKLEAGFADAGVTHEFLEIEKVTSQEEVDAILEVVVSTVRERSPDSVNLDITHAFRSLPMVFFASLVYVDALGDTHLDGIYYAEYQGKESPIIDLTYLYTLLEWYHALRSYENTGSLASVQALLAERKQSLFRRGEQPHELAAIARTLGGVSRSFDSGLPMEAGIATRDALAELATIDESNFVGPEGTFFGPLADELDGYDIEQDVTTKTEVELDTAELRRQATIVEFYREKGKYWLALECAREVVLNRVLYEHGYRDPGEWLEPETRKKIRGKNFHRINDDNQHGNSDSERETESDVAQLWDRLTAYRNLFAHSGFKPEAVADAEKVGRVLDEVRVRMDEDAFWDDVA